MPRVRRFDYALDYDLLLKGEKESFAISFPEIAYSEKSVEGRLWSIERWPELTFVLQQKLRPVGYIVGSMRHVGGADHGYIDSVYLLPTARSKGNGRLLIEHLVDELRKRKVSSVVLDVSVANEVARGVYESIGFTPFRTQMRLEI